MADDKTTNPAPAEASADEAAVAAAAAKATANKKKKLLLLGSGALAVVGILVAVSVLFVFGKEKPEDATAEDKGVKVPPMAIYDVPTMTANLLTDEATSGPRYLKVTLALELENAADSEAAAALMPRLQDDWASYLRQLRPADLQGSGAMQTLREGLLRRAIQTMQPVQVKAVLLRDILVQ